jgi:hypothetical protein
MLDPYYITVWDAAPPEQFKLPLKSGSVLGNVVTIQSRNHWLESGDIVNIVASTGYEAFAITNTVVTKINEDSFSYTVHSYPGLFPNPRPGLPIVLWLTCNKYSAMLVNPERVRMDTIPDGTSIAVQTRNADFTWRTEKVVSNLDGIIDFVFINVFKEVRFMRWTGSAVPKTIALSSSAPPLQPPGNHTYEIPEDLTAGTIELMPTTSSIAGSAIAYSTSPTIIDSFSTSLFRSANYQIQVSDNVNYETSEVRVVHDGTVVYLSERGNVITTASSLGSFDAQINDSVLSLIYVSTSATHKTIRFIRTALST